MINFRPHKTTITVDVPKSGEIFFVSSDMLVRSPEGGSEAFYEKKLTVSEKFHFFASDSFFGRKILTWP